MRATMSGCTRGRACQDAAPHATGSGYVNFLTEEEGSDRVHAAYGENYDRLVEIKTKWDPNNVFRMNKNIPPTAPDA